MDIGGIVELGKFGTVGVMLGLIVLSSFVAYLMWKLATNHIHHSDEVFRENTKALTELIDVIKELRKQ